MKNSPVETMRIDKWLWAARFYKTRALATGAIGGGKVHLNGARCKPAHQLAVGDRLEIHKGPYSFNVTVERLTLQRRPATEARVLYSEAEESVTARHELYQQRQLEGHRAGIRSWRPDKRARRRIRQFKQQ